jgi:hypothetical protein
MLHACNAVDGTGRKRYPQLGVAARFKRVTRDSLDIFRATAMPGLNLKDIRFPAAVKSDLPDRRPDIADVIYGIHRCSHGHGDDLPSGFELTPIEGNIGDFMFGHNGRVQLSASVVLGLLAVVIFAPENQDQVIPASYKMRLCERVFVVTGWWGGEDRFRELVKIDQSPGFMINFGPWWDDWEPL